MVGYAASVELRHHEHRKTHGRVLRVSPRLVEWVVVGIVIGSVLPAERQPPAAKSADRSRGMIERV